ncbi:MAG TPA: ankyrin repeat domain-containing protein [Terriglobales bacterium]|nr:ankyrin repeat domain-containing protein [Terriglobales bacterium]
MATASDVISAIQAGDGARLRELIGSAPELAGTRDASGVSAIMLSLYHRRRDLADVLVRAHPVLDVFEAATLGRIDRLEELLRVHPDLAHAWSGDGFTALHFAAYFSQEEAARLLLDAGADARATARNATLVQPLHSAASARAHKVAEQLLQSGADVNAKQQKGFTPLQSAAHNGDTAILSLLLRYGADREQRNEEGKTALDLAREGGKEEAARMLSGAA